MSFKDQSIEDLTKKLEFADSRASQHEQILLISKSLYNLQESLSFNSNKLAASMDGLKGEMVKFADSNNRYANAMKWLTGGLVFIGACQVIVTLIK